MVRPASLDKVPSLPSQHQPLKSHAKVIFKITMITLFIISAIAVIATLAIGTPIALPIGIATIAIALESVLLGIYKCVLPKKTPPIHIIDKNKPLTDELLLDTLIKNPLLNHDDILDLRRVFLKQHFNADPDLNKLFENKHIKTSHLINNQNSTLIYQNKNNVQLLLSEVQPSKPNLLILPQDDLESRRKYDNVLYRDDLFNRPLLDKVSQNNLLHNTPQLVIFVRDHYVNELNKIIASYTTPPSYVSFTSFNLSHLNISQEQQAVAQEAFTLAFFLGIQTFLKQTTLNPNFNMIISLDRMININ